MDERELLTETAHKLQDLIIGSMGGSYMVKNKERYRRLREVLTSAVLINDVLPSIVESCRTLEECLHEIEGVSGFEFEDRRQIVWQNFKPLFDRLENRGNIPLSAPAQDTRLEDILATLARLFAAEGAAVEVAVLAQALPHTEAHTEQVGFNQWKDISTLVLEIPVKLYSQINERRYELEKRLFEKLQDALTIRVRDIHSIQIAPVVSSGSDWRPKALAWSEGKHITNQGRVRSDNIASLECDGLLFRSPAEIELYQAFKSKGVCFAPLPVFVRGGAKYSRIEPDFIVVKDGLMMMVEVDGDTVHRESPAEAHERATMLVHEGMHLERIESAKCDTPEKAKATADRLVSILSKLRSSR